MSELEKRLSVALVGIPFAFIVIIIGGITFGAVITIISSFALWEFYNLTERKGIIPFKIYGLLAGIVYQLSFIFKNSALTDNVLIPEIIIFVLGLLMLQLFSKRTNIILNIAITMGGFLYITMFFSCLIGLRAITNPNWINSSLNFYSLDKSNLIGAFIVLGIIISVWVCDSAAYFIGSKWGKHKLYPKVSPKKSWEGAIAGFIFSVASFCIIMKFTIPDFPFTHSLVIGLIIGIFGQIGDLTESQFKRDAGVKDSSSILPGHGGILDRFDSILFISPIIYIYLTFVIK